MLLAHGRGGEKSDRFSRRGEQDRPALWNLSSKQISCNCSGGTVATGILLFHVKHCSSGRRSFASGKRGFHSCFCLPACCNCPVALSEFVTYFIKIINCELASFKKCNCIRKNLLQNTICFANVGYSPTPRQHFWKTAAPKNFLFACSSWFAIYIL